MSSNSERRGRDFGQRIGKAEEILANQKRLNYKLSECNLLKHIPPSGTVWVPFANSLGFGAKTESEARR